MERWPWMDTITPWTTNFTSFYVCLREFALKANLECFFLWCCTCVSFVWVRDGKNKLRACVVCQPIPLFAYVYVYVRVPASTHSLVHTDTNTPRYTFWQTPETHKTVYRTSRLHCLRYHSPGCTTVASRTIKPLLSPVSFRVHGEWPTESDANFDSISFLFWFAGEYSLVSIQRTKNSKFQLKKVSVNIN